MTKVLYYTQRRNRAIVRRLDMSLYVLYILLIAIAVFILAFVYKLDKEIGITEMEFGVNTEYAFEERIPFKEQMDMYIDSLPVPEVEIEVVSEPEVIIQEESQEIVAQEVVSVRKVEGITTGDVEGQIYLLAKGIHGEASICDREEKYKVGTVIMNRVASSKYPNTVEEVLAQPNQYSCYQDSRWYTEEPSAEEMEIAKDIYLNGVRVFGPEVIFQSKTCEGECVDKTPWHEYGMKKVE